MLHLYTHVASCCSLLTRVRGGLVLLPKAGGVEGQRGAGSHPASHPRSHALDQRKSPCIFLTCRRNPKMLPGRRSFLLAPVAPAQSLKTLGPPTPVSVHPKSRTPWAILQAAPCRSPALALPGFVGFNRAAHPPSAEKIKANPWEGELGSEAAPARAAAHLRAISEEPSSWGCLWGPARAPVPSPPQAAHQLQLRDDPWRSMD